MLVFNLIFWNDSRYRCSEGLHLDCFCVFPPCNIFNGNYTKVFYMTY
jgi:hypothetical protein